MTYKKTNGNTEVDYHNIIIGKFRFSLTTYDVFKLISLIVAIIIFSWRYVFPVYADIQTIRDTQPVIIQSLDTVKEHQKSILYSLKLPKKNYQIY